MHNAIRAPGMVEIALYDFETDSLDQHDVSAQHPDVVKELSAEMDAWKRQAEAQRVKPDAETARTLNAEELEGLRALGYLP